MRFGTYRISLLALSALCAFRARDLSAQAQVIALPLLAPGTLSVTVTSGATQSIVGVTDNAVNSFPSPVVIQTDWDVNPGQTVTVNLMAYFSTPAQALVGGTTQIPSSRILGRMLTGVPTTFTAMTQTGVGGVGTAGGSLRLLAVTVTGANKTTTRTDNLDLQLNLVGFPALLVGSYTGVLNLRAVTQ